MVLPEFTAHAISRLHPKLQRSADQLIAAMCAAGPDADFAEAFAKPMASQAICHLLAVPITDGPLLTGIATTLADDSQGPQAQGAAFLAVTEYMEKFIDHRIADPGSDLFSRLATAPLNDGKVTRDELVALAIMLLMAGHDTNAKMIVLGVGTLLDHPDVVARIVTDEAAAQAAVEELLRLHSIGDDDGFRVATADMEVGGITIRPGEGIVPLVRHANYDHAVYARPDCMDIDLKENRHLAFGTGPHLCLGRELARAVQMIAYRTLFSAIPSLRRTSIDPENLQITGWASS
ncbi:cytochrome P450 [Acidisoma sp. L85]|uniref:cytochrome P450 n=1 Tax=Acidisoma sp. L85 TaxID=1641850 RepID=UPI001C20A662|nr:cytochrome P450 [Acidisoma sp. L85]